MLGDVKYALRMMGRNPGMAAAAAITIALGLGATTAIFSVVNTVLLRPLPYKDPDRLVSIWITVPSFNVKFALPDYDAFLKWRERAKSFEGAAAVSRAAGNLTNGGEPEHVKVLRVNANLFRLLGVRPPLGRDFTDEDDRRGAARVALLDHKLWQRRFGADTSIAGKPVTIDGNAYTIVGVLPNGFETPLDEADVYVPLAEAPGRGAMEVAINGFARLKPGVTVDAANTELNGIADQVCRERGWQIKHGAWVVRTHDFIVRDIRLTLIVLFAAVGFVLLIACANVANLLLARAASREREVAVRIAMGAGRGRLLRQFLHESVVLSALGGVVGIVLAYWAVRALPLLAPEAFPFAERVAIDLPVLGFAALATLATGIVFGTAPAISASRGAVAEALKAGGRTGEQGGRNRFRNSLVVVEVALALMLACGAALLMRSLLQLREVNPGFKAEGVLVASIDLPKTAYAEPERRLQFYLPLLERLRTMPGIRAAGMVNQLPFEGISTGVGLYVQDAPPSRPSDVPIFQQRSVDPEYFRTMQIPLKRGRFFNEHDRGGDPVAVINETMARYWGKLDPVGRRFGDGLHWITVVAVAGDVHHMSLAQPPYPEFYLPYWQMPQPSMTLVARTAGDPLRAATAVKQAIKEIDKGQPVSKLASLAVQVDKSTASRRFAVALLSLFAAVALALAAVGIYGVVSFSVARRAQEIGIRVALGAPPSRVVAGVVKRAALLAGGGIALGVAGALALTRTVRSLLFGVSAMDPVSFAGVTVLLAAVALAASYLPARRAARVDPMVALRQE